MKYEIELTERVTYKVIVEADSQEMAIEKARLGNWKRIKLGSIDVSYLEIHDVNEVKA